MEFKVTSTNPKAIEVAAQRWLNDMMSEAVEITRPHIHVDTGRLQKSLRYSPSRVRAGRIVESKAIMGGVRLFGVFREQGILRDVDYAWEEEMRHPQMRGFFIPAITRLLQK